MVIQIIAIRLYFLLYGLNKNEVACAGLYREVCGIVQSTLGGTKDKFVDLSPSSLETDCARYWAYKSGNQFLQLGSGMVDHLVGKLRIYPWRKNSSAIVKGPLDSSMG